VKRRMAAGRGHPAPAADRAQPGGGPGPAAESGPQPAERDGAGARNGPVLVLSYPHSGAGHVQDRLAAGTDLACTSGTGIIPLSVTAAEAWRRVEGQPGQAMSRLAVSTIRGLLTAQVAVILAGSGKSRWCELVTAPPSAADPFLQVFPQTGFVCVHRCCGDVIRAGVRASPWGVHGPGLVPYFLSHPGNSVAALAAFWASSTEQLLAFEAANPGAAHRVRYEDVLAAPGRALAAVRASLQLGGAAAAGLPGEPSGPVSASPDSTAPDPAGRASAGPGTAEPGTAGPGTAGPGAPEPPLPVETIPEPLRERVGRLHDQLGYPPLGG